MKSLKTLSTALVITLTLVSFTSSALAASTPEMHLISSAIALSGQNLSASEKQNRVAAELKEYNATAPAENRIERTQEALVSLNIMTPAQAEAFASQANASAGALANGHFASNQEAQTAVMSQLDQVLSQAKGARFDAGDLCDLSGMVFLGSFAGGIALGLATGGNTADTIVSVAMGLMVTSFIIGGVTCF